MTQLEISLLGVGIVRRSGLELRFRTRKVLALLVYLALKGGMQSRDHLAGLFWIDAEPSAGRNSLRNTLSYLREALGNEQFLHIERQVVGLNFDSDLIVDVLELEQAATLALEPGDVDLEVQISRLEAAASLCRGELLDGFALGDGGAFDVWLLEQREVSHRNMQIVLERLARLQSEAGQFSRAIETALKLVGLDRLNESGYRILIGLQHANGDRVGALKSFEVLQNTLHNELGLLPTPETLALVERVRLELPAKTPRTPRVPSLPTLLLEGRMVGRVTEFVRLVEAYHASALGQPRFVTISGEPGIGKTRLASEFLTWAASQGATILRGRAFETGGGLAYQALTEALRRFLRAEPDPTSILRPVWLAELSKLLPELLERLPDLPVPTSDETTARTRLFEAVAKLGSNLAARVPLVLFIDDLQWADQASLELIAYAARRWLEEENPVLIVFTVRAEALVNLNLQSWFVSLAHELQHVSLELGALSSEDTSQLLETIGGASADFSRWLYQETNGQPLFIMETLKSLAERGLMLPQVGKWQVQLKALRASQTAPGVRSVILARLTRLSTVARAILEAAAVLGQGFDFAVVRAVTDLEEDTALGALDELLRSRLILETGSNYVFSHDKIRETAFQEATEARRRVYHRRAFQALSNPRTSASVLARHAHGAHLWLEAFRASVQAGDEATNVYAWRESAEHYERARIVLIEQPDGVEISAQLERQEIGRMYGKLVNRYRTLNEEDRIQPLPAETRELALRLQDPWLEAHSQIFESNLIAWQNLELVLERLELARVIFERIGDQEGLFEVELNRLHSIWKGPRHLRQGISLLEKMLPQARELGKLHTKSTLQSLANFHQELGQWEQAIGYWTEIVQERLNQRTDNYAYMRENLGLCQLNIGQLEPALSNLLESYQIKTEIDANPTWTAMAACYYAYGLLETGEVARAYELTQAAFALRLKANLRYVAEYGLAFGMTSIATGRLSEARDALTYTIQIVQALGEAELQVWGHTFLDFLESHLCSAFAFEGDWISAFEHAKNAIKWRFETNNFRGLHAPRLKHWLEVEALLRGGETELAQELLDKLEEVVQEGERLEISVLHARAVLEAWNEHIEVALQLLEKAKTIAVRLGLPLKDDVLTDLLANKS